jgi:hypothetical protein
VGNPERKSSSHERKDKSAIKEAKKISGVIVVKFLLLFNVNHQIRNPLINRYWVKSWQNS